MWHGPSVEKFLLISDTTAATERRTTGSVSKHVHHLMDYWLSDRLDTVCEAGQSGRWFGDVQ